MTQPRPFRVRTGPLVADQWDGRPDHVRWGWVKNADGWAIAKDVRTREYGVQPEAGTPWVPLAVGDWVVRTSDGRFAVVTDAVFRTVFEPAAAAETTLTCQRCGHPEYVHSDRFPESCNRCDCQPYVGARPGK